MITVNNLSFSYNKKQPKVIKGIDFSVDKGEIFGFLGPSGAGKTTTQRAIIGLLRGYEGSIQIMGRERSEWNNEIFERIGVAFDSPNLYIKLTAIENLELMASYYQTKPRDILKLLKRVQLYEAKDKKVESYSRGMKMRLNFIRAILHNPTLIFLDEPTAGLDPVNAKIIKDMIVELKHQGKTIFLTTHNMEVADVLCDTIAFIVDGSIPLIDSPKNLKLTYGSHKVIVEFMERQQITSREFDFQEIKHSKEFLDILQNKEIKTIHSQEATLEDIFIQITGRELS
ncbi:ATP-binding cassette domain-containing protein [Alkalibaculum sp. M08DMB]|uniref:ATP-binding cassette domain-containing protein n=1 Tax=Alkalibaculum sporogenes TaxID=2655001 RepID=A0A6A7K8N5_9FIRM|nr:ABC transporter ATP-binding protein [Alkalibaculum sporogenes]MPW25784.1 ATP-binding cassette domain-containing protein [Alkalibaculum sporogenes]